MERIDASSLEPKEEKEEGGDEDGEGIDQLMARGITPSFDGPVSLLPGVVRLSRELTSAASSSAASLSILAAHISSSSLLLCL